MKFSVWQRWRTKGKADPSNKQFNEVYRHCENCIVGDRNSHGNYILRSYTINGYDVLDGLPPLRLCKPCYKKIISQIRSNGRTNKKEIDAITRYWDLQKTRKVE